VKPFLLLATRAEDEAADDEYAALLEYGGLTEGELRRHRLERDALPELDLDEWSGVIVGGGPFNVSDPDDAKSPVQLRAEAELDQLVGRVVAADFPFLGCCYGIGILGRRFGGLVDRTYAEPIGAPRITLTSAGQADPVFGVLPAVFEAFVGHKEAVSVVPSGAVVLAGSPACPVQAIRFGTSVYATQFHPELNADGLCTRVEVYRDYGYFPPEQVDSLKAMARASAVSEPPRLVKAFVESFAR